MNPRDDEQAAHRKYNNGQIQTGSFIRWILCVQSTARLITAGDFPFPSGSVDAAEGQQGGDTGQDLK